jgi:glycosyltransferase involved in cell wall biosynthesis
MLLLLDSFVFSLQKAGGISSYWFNLSKRLIKSQNNLIFIEEKFIGNIEHEKILPLKRTIYKLFFTLKPFSRFINIDTKGIKTKFIFHSSYYRITKNRLAVNVVTIHDFIHEKYFSGLRKWLHIYQKSYSINNADVIITVSNNTKKDLLKLYPKINPNNVRVVYNGVSTEYFKKNDKKNRINKSILFVGSRNKYKNFKKLVSIISEIGNFKLIIVGPPLTDSEKIFLNKNILDNWENYSYLSNKELNNLYNSVFALAYVSSYEGFGIPIVESMRAGCPFIALNKSSIPEVAGNAGVLLDALNTTNFRKALNKISNSRDKIVEKGLKRSKIFSWNKCYSETIKIYEEYLNK